MAPAGNMTGGQQPTNRGNDINPNDIESINVLKGPAATALYGIQAASGAIIITTKKGGGGRKSAVSFNSSVTMDKVGLLPKLQSQYSQGSNGVYSPPEDGASTSWGRRSIPYSWMGQPAIRMTNTAISSANRVRTPRSPLRRTIGIISSKRGLPIIIAWLYPGEMRRRVTGCRWVIC